MTPALAPLPITEEAALDELIQLSEELDGLVTRNPSCFFTPNPGQLRVMREINRAMSQPGAAGKVITVYWLGGNDGGKTRLLAEIALNLMEGPQSPWFDTPFFRDFPRPCDGRFTSTHKALQEGLIREIRKAFVDHLEPGYPVKGGHPYESLWKTRSGSTLELLTWDMGVTTHAGAFKQFVLKDEPGPKDVSDEDDARLRRGGLSAHFMTPVDETGYSRNVGWIFDRIAQGEEGLYPGLSVVYSDCEDNCEECAHEQVVFPDGSVRESRGIVPHETIVDKYNRWKADSPATLQARFFGRHVRELGRVLTHWNEKIHVVPDRELVPADHWVRMFALDTHPDKPEIGNYVYFTPTGEMVVKRELVCEGLIRDAAAEIKQLYQLWGTPELELIDPLASTPNAITGRSVLNTYNGIHKFHFQTAGAEKADKHLAVDRLNEMLHGVPIGGVDDKGKAKRRPLLLVSDACPLTISQAKRWMRLPNGQPGKTNDDTWENLYRLALQAPRPGEGRSRRAILSQQRPRSPLVRPRRREL